VDVEDSGIGIESDKLKILFEGFQRLDLEKNRNIEGTGLGLAITKKLIDMMNGQIQVESTYGKGSVFSFTLEQNIIDNTPLGNFTVNYQKSEKHIHKYIQSFIAPDASILVVDDNHMNLMVVRKLLEKTQMHIYDAMSGMEALDLMRHNVFDIILLDHMMPGIDGIETLKRAKKMEDNLSINAPIIALTANAVSGAQDMYLSAGFDSYLSKPIDGKTLEEHISKFLPAHKVSYITHDDNEPETAATEDTSPAANPSTLIDYNLGIQYCGDLKDVYMEILEIYASSYDETYNYLLKYYESEDWNNYTIHIHSLKSNSLNIGAKMLSEKCLMLEKAGKLLRSGEDMEVQKAFVQKNHPLTMDLYKQTIDTANEYINNNQ